MSDPTNVPATGNTASNAVYSTQTPVPDPAPKSKPDDPQPDAPTDTPKFTQADVEKMIQKRVPEYDAMKSRLAEIDDRDKSELDKVIQARDEALAASATATRELSILRAASKHGVPAEYVDLIDGADDDAIDAKAKKVAELAKAQSPAVQDPFASGRYTDPGQSPASAPDAQQIKEQFARQLFKVSPRQ